METKRVSLDVVKSRYSPVQLIIHNQDIRFALLLKRLLVVRQLRLLVVSASQFFGEKRAEELALYQTTHCPVSLYILVVQHIINS